MSEQEQEARERRGAGAEAEGKEAEGKEAEGKEAEILEEEVSNEQVQQDLEETKNQLMRTAAELENYRKRTRREVAEQRQYGAMPVLRDLLPVMDNLRRAVESSEQNADLESLAQGTRMVLSQFDQVLNQQGVEEIRTVGQPFDPQVHEAALQQSSKEHPAGTVIGVLQTGYLLHDRIIRPAKVIVSSGPPEEEADQDDAGGELPDSP